MARRLGRLKASEIGKLGPGRYHDGGGLYLAVGKGAARSWIFRFRKDGKLHDYGLGPTHAVSLATARQKAFECRGALYAGNNPVETRKAKRLDRVLAAAKAMTFEKAADLFITAHSAGWRNGKNEEQWRQSLAAYAFPEIGSLPVQAVDTTMVLRVLEPIWNGTPETASRVRGRIESVLDWATARGYRQGENPARWRGHLDHLLPARSRLGRVKHHPALSYTEIVGFMAKLRQQERIAARALEFLILTAARSAEVRGATWSEINIADRAWTIPGERMKAGREHRIPLSDRAIAIIAEMSRLRANDYVFPGLHNRLDEQALRRTLLSLRGDLTVHGFRSTFRDWISEMTAYPREVAEQALAHGISDQVEAAYRRGDLFEKRRRLMQDWADYCAAPARGEVVAIGAARA